MKRFLVTGGAGFIGSHIVERLLKEGHFVRVLDNLSSGKKENLFFVKGLSPQKAKDDYTQPYRKGMHLALSEGKYAASAACAASCYTRPYRIGRCAASCGKGTVPDFELIEGDIRDRSACDKACKGIDYVLHQAALRSVPKSLVNPSDYNEVNIQGTLNMLEAARASKVRCFVFASSSSVYGDALRFPEKETDLPLLISPYALSKLAGEYYCRIFSTHFNLPTVSLRYFNVFGPRQSLDDEYAVVIPKFITCMLHDERPPIFGNGRQSRDFTFVENVVQANFLAAQRRTARGGVFNVASGRDYSILELVKQLNVIMDKNIKPVLLKPRAGDVFRTLADLSRSRKMLGFKPGIDFSQGLGSTVEYFRNTQ